MAEERTRTGEPGRALVARLEARIARLQGIDVGGDAREQLQQAIKELQKDVEDLKLVASHVFVFFPEE
jgi:UDP-N-acetyl-D-mannosaminuronic acid transferase (WecB/TagA/CpsF family)